MFIYVCINIDVDEMFVTTPQSSGYSHIYMLMWMHFTYMFTPKISHV
jgi:hypothetical protein